MKLLFLSLVLSLFTGCLFGQDLASISDVSQEEESPTYVPGVLKKSPLRKNIYFELGGSGGFGSFNLEWNFRQPKKIRWMLRTGISGTYIDKNNGAGIIFPVMIHGVYGQKHGLDFGIGQALTITTRGSVFLRAPISIGYRLEPSKSRIFYRFSYTPIVSYLLDFQWQHWGGISIGYRLIHKPRRR